MRTTFGNKISEADFRIVCGSPWAERYISFFWTYLSITYNNFMATGEGLARAMFPVGNFLWVLSEELVTAFWTGSCGPVFGIHTTYYSISWLMEECVNLMIFSFCVLKSLWTSNWILFHHVDIPKFAIASSNVPFRTNRIFRSFEVAVVTRTITHGYLRSFLWMLHVWAIARE